MNNLTDHLTATRPDVEQRFTELLAIPSVSTDPQHAPDLAAACRFAADHLTASGLTATIHETEGHPLVLAHSTPDQVANPQAPTVLFYGHLDVQPAALSDGWSNDPFNPTLLDGKVYARGASDDKAGVLSFLEALRAYHDTNTPLPGPVTVLLECEEEIGSPSLPAFLEQHQSELTADIVVICDTTMWDYPIKPTDGEAFRGISRPPDIAITTALRGLAYFDLVLQGPDRDLHSGVYGGALANPANALTRILGQLHDNQHRIAIPGFYDDVLPAPDHGWQHLNFDADAFTQEVGLPPSGEADLPTLVRRWARPSCDINGLSSGFQGPGAKTVIASTANAKVSFRLAPGQDPHRIETLFRDWLNTHDLHGCTLTVTTHGLAYPVNTPTDSPYLQPAIDAARDTTGRPAVLVQEGASIPVVADFKRILGIDSLLIGFGLNSDNIHAPDEHIDLDRLHLGTATLVRLLEHTAALAP
ncbi:MAG: M20/M25/M40 family metallo-hydrolase [Planctomycetota bacterium]